MRKQIAVIVAVLATAGSAMAATEGSITISGNVPASTEIKVTPETGYNALPIVAGETDLKVATVNEKSNWPKGYKVTLQSLNAGTGTQATLLPADTTSNTDVVNYSMKYDGTAVTLTEGKATVTTAGKRTEKDGVNKDLKVTFAANPWIAADTYSDTITLTIATN